jgi:hypothetical protein
MRQTRSKSTLETIRTNRFWVHRKTLMKEKNMTLMIRVFGLHTNLLK